MALAQIFLISFFGGSIGLIINFLILNGGLDVAAIRIYYDFMIAFYTSLILFVLSLSASVPLLIKIKKLTPVKFLTLD